MQDKIIIDLDNTITIDESSENYSEKEVNKKILNAINIAKENSINITIFSSRNMNSYSGDLKKINSITKPVAIEWLNEKNVPYDEIIFGKPWAGKNGWYVDDRNLSLEEFIFRFSGPFHQDSFDVVIPFFNEKENIMKTYKKTKLLERIIDIRNFFFINNGSNDGSNEIFNQLANSDHKLKIIEIRDNIGYGNGIKKGLLASKADYLLINHADGQFDAYNFLLSNADIIDDNPDAIMPSRLNRNSFNNFCSLILRIMLSLINQKRIHDFNGQPKIFKKNKIKNIEYLPSDFCIDYAIYRVFEDSAQKLPIIEKKREAGSSSWNQDLLKWLYIFFKYLSFAIFFKKSSYKK